MNSRQKIIISREVLRDILSFGTPEQRAQLLSVLFPRRKVLVYFQRKNFRTMHKVSVIDGYYLVSLTDGSESSAADKQVNTRVDNRSRSV